MDDATRLVAGNADVNGAGPELKSWAMSARRTLDDCMAEGLSAEIALARLAVYVDAKIGAEELASAALAMRSTDILQRRWLQAIAELLLRKGNTFDELRATACSVSHDRLDGETTAAVLTRLASGFDRAAAISPAASVQLSSLGDEQILAVTTAEIVTWLERQGFTGAGKDILDVGCGIGRFERALHPKANRVVGIDISSNMIAIARRRCVAFGNVEFRQTTGFDLADFADTSFEGVLAADSFPYLVLAGLAEQHFSEIARVLRRGGMAAILNYSYREPPALDRADIHRLASASGMQILVDGEMPFNSWDGTAFLLRAGGT